MTEKKPIRTITVASGKGGVGKSNIVANLAIAFNRLGNKTLIFDADLGLSNIDVLLHLAPKYNISHVLNGDMTLNEILVEGPQGIKLLPASSGVQSMTSLDEFQRLKLIEAFDAYDDEVDILLIDTAAGISENVAFFCIAAQETIIVCSPEPTSLTDAYALIKVLNSNYQEKRFRVLVNSVKDSTEALTVFKRLTLATEKFLSVSLDYIGYLPFDEAVRRAVRAQSPFLVSSPESRVSKQMMELAGNILRTYNTNIKGSLQIFLGNLLSASAGQPV